MQHRDREASRGVVTIEPLLIGLVGVLLPVKYSAAARQYVGEKKIEAAIFAFLPYVTLAKSGGIQCHARIPYLVYFFHHQRRHYAVRALRVQRTDHGVIHFA